VARLAGPTIIDTIAGARGHPDKRDKHGETRPTNGAWLPEVLSPSDKLAKGRRKVSSLMPEAEREALKGDQVEMHVQNMTLVFRVEESRL
jgi:hypothetical protein